MNLARQRRAGPLLLVVTLALAGAAIGCHRPPSVVERQLKPADSLATLDRRSPYLKVHMRNGELYVLSRWSTDSASRRIAGEGDLLGMNRDLIRHDRFSIALDSVALLETNRVHGSGTTAGMTILTGLSLAATVACATNPKACFGSCPTFYVSDGTRNVLQAEGFSASVAPALEARDIDALYRARPAGRDFEVRMRNEAYETHVVRWLRVLALPRPDTGRVFAGPGASFWASRRQWLPTACRAPDGDCLHALSAFDGVERFSRTDSADLAAREVVDLDFPAAGSAPMGIVLASRQTLVSTFVFYSALGYMGSTAGHWLAALSTGGPMARAGLDDFRALLGGVDVLVQDDSGRWVLAGSSQEMGPLATEVRVIPLPVHGSGPVHVRLRMARGQWRLDYAALASLDGPVTPLRLDPTEVLHDSVPDSLAREQLLDSARALVTFPGDEYTMRYRLPAHPDRYEIFLDSRGYYLEWMRAQWLAQEDPRMAAMMVLDPAAFLRRLAPEFKEREAGLEDAFWKSRYVRP